MQKLAKTALWVALFGAVSSFAETAGWKNDGRARYVIPPAAKALWTAPLEKGLEAFAVTWSGGGAGTVAIVDLDGDKALEIVKTNDVGAVRIRPKEPFALPPAVKTKAFAAVSSSADDFEFARGELRMGPVGHEAGLPKGCTGLTVGGFKQMTWMPNTAPGAYAVKCAYADPLAKGEQAMSSITVSGTASRSLWRAWRIELVAAAVEAVRKDPARQPFLNAGSYNEDMMAADDFARRLAADTEHSARVKMKDGYPRIFLDGVEAPPILYKGMGCADGNVRFAGANLAKSVPLMVAPVNFRGVPPRRGLWHEDGFDAATAVEEMRLAMRCAPDSLFVLAVGLGAYPTFTTRYPDETWRTADGRLVCGNYNLANKTVAPGETPPKGYWPWVSYHSLVWREQIKTNLTILVRALQEAGLSKRIVGVHLTGFHDGQFAVAQADYSPPAVQAYRRWTGRADAQPPPLSRKGMFDPVSDAEQIAWMQFQKRAPFAMLEDLARHLRKAFAKDIITIRWCMGAFGAGMPGAWDITPFVNSDIFDIIVPQPDYRRRSPAIPLGVKMPFSSINRHGKLFVLELDLRTWGVWGAGESELRDAGASRARDPAEWCAIHRRAAGQMLARHSGFWYYDMSRGWFRPPEVAADIAEVADVARHLAARKPSPWHPQVAFVVDEESLFKVNLLAYPPGSKAGTAAGQPNVYSIISDQLHRLAASGVPFDFRLASDFDADPALAAAYRHVVRRLTPSDKYLTPKEFNAQARAAGAYVPVPPNVLEVDMSGDFLSVHALRNGTFEFVLPFPCAVRNVKSGKLEQVEDGKFRISVEAGQTCWFTFEGI